MYQYRLHQLLGSQEFLCPRVFALSDAGVAVGAFTKGRSDYLGLAIWSSLKDVRLIATGNAEVRGINAHGQFVGWTSDDKDKERALFGNASDDPLGPPSTLRRVTKFSDSVCSWKTRSMATGINAAGDIVGATVGKGQVDGWIWSEERGLSPVEQPSRGNTVSVYELCAPISINDEGLVLGSVCRSSRLNPIWDSAGVIVDMKDSEGQATQISNSGDILCSPWVLRGSGFVTLENARGCSDVKGVSINASGAVVGSGRAIKRDGGPPTFACIWDAAGRGYNLNDLIDADEVQLQSASAINLHGWVACEGWVGAKGQSLGQYRAFLLEPIGRN